MAQTIVITLYIAIMLLQFVVAGLTIANLILIRRHWAAHRQEREIARRFAAVVARQSDAFRPSLYDFGIPKGDQSRPDDPPSDYM